MAASYEARRLGVRGAMGGRRARRLCPGLIVVPPRFQAYVDASRELFRVFEDFSPVVEGLSLEEAFLDVRGLERISGTPREIAARLRAAVREKVGLPLTVGIASSKVVAKIASGAAKPDGLLVVPAGEELAFLHPLPVERIWGVGPATTRKLHALGILTVGRAAQHSEAYLSAVLGPAAGRYLHAVANNRDHRRVRPNRGRRSMGSQSAGRHPLETVDAVLVGLVDRVAYRMRSAGRVGRTVVLRLRFEDFTRVTRSQTLPVATASTWTILAGCAGAPRRLVADDPIPGPHPRRHHRCEPGPRARRPAARPPARPAGGRRASTRRSTSCASASAATRSRSPSSSTAGARARRSMSCERQPTSGPHARVCRPPPGRVSGPPAAQPPLYGKPNVPPAAVD